jgi:hypothetical protein
VRPSSGTHLPPPLQNLLLLLMPLLPFLHRFLSLVLFLDEGGPGHLRQPSWHPNGLLCEGKFKTQAAGVCTTSSQHACGVL